MKTREEKEMATLIGAAIFILTSWRKPARADAAEALASGVRFVDAVRAAGLAPEQEGGGDT
jgi:hypothetical protein